MCNVFDPIESDGKFSCGWRYRPRSQFYQPWHSTTKWRSRGSFKEYCFPAHTAADTLQSLVELSLELLSYIFRNTPPLMAVLATTEKSSSVVQADSTPHDFNTSYDAGRGLGCEAAGDGNSAKMRVKRTGDKQKSLRVSMIDTQTRSKHNYLHSATRLNKKAYLRTKLSVLNSQN